VSGKDIQICSGSLPVEYVFTSTVTTDKADGLDGGVVADSVYGRNLTVNDVENTIREAF
jgi:hypothetical protein